ncbi:13598_t:CDS:2, partial [Racocetra fulgida]
YTNADEISNINTIKTIEELESNDGQLKSSQNTSKLQTAGGQKLLEHINADENISNNSISINDRPQNVGDRHPINSPIRSQNISGPRNATGQRYRNPNERRRQTRSQNILDRRALIEGSNPYADLQNLDTLLMT